MNPANADEQVSVSGSVRPPSDIPNIPDPNRELPPGETAGETNMDQSNSTTGDATTKETAGATNGVANNASTTKNSMAASVADDDENEATASQQDKNADNNSSKSRASVATSVVGDNQSQAGSTSAAGEEAATTAANDNDNPANNSTQPGDAASHASATGVATAVAPQGHRINPPPIVRPPCPQGNTPGSSTMFYAGAQHYAPHNGAVMYTAAQHGGGIIYGQSGASPPDVTIMSNTPYLLFNPPMMAPSVPPPVQNSPSYCYPNSMGRPTWNPVASQAFPSSPYAPHHMMHYMNQVAQPGTYYNMGQTSYVYWI